MVLDDLTEELKKQSTHESIGEFFRINYVEYAFNNYGFLSDMRDTRNKCMKLMDISEEEMKKFSESRLIDTKSEDDEAFYKVVEQWKQETDVIGEAQKKYKTNINE